MLWAYDLEFWTLRFAAEDYDYSEKKLADRIVYELVKQGYVYKHFDKLTPSSTYEDHLFREETKYNFRVRYALSPERKASGAEVLQALTEYYFVINLSLIVS